MRTITVALVLVLFSAVAARAQEPVSDGANEKLKGEWERRFREADKDRSRSLDRIEAQAGLPKVLLRNFERIDANADGVITPEELWAMRAREAAEREARRAARLGGGPPR